MLAKHLGVGALMENPCDEEADQRSSTKMACEHQPGLTVAGWLKVYAYFGVHVLGEFQNGVHSGPGVWVLL